MEDVSKTPIQWKVVSSRAYYWGKRIMKPGQVFTALESDLPEELKSMVIAVNEIIPAKEPEIPVTPVTYRIKERKGGEYYEVLDSKGKKVSEKNLTKEEAELMVKKLEQ